MSDGRRRMFLDAARKFPGARWWNITIRTIHIGVAGVLLGGHVFGAPRAQLHPWLYLTIASGVFLAALEAYPDGKWLHQLRGVAVAIKILLMCLASLFWPWRAYILAIVVIIASVGSHAPGRYRYYSILYRRVIDH